MHLHLHIGAHKTATTHLQAILEATKDQHGAETIYVSNDVARNNISMEGSRATSEGCFKFFQSLSTQPAKRIIISEENICGHTHHMFRHKTLYKSLEKRLSSLSFLPDLFETIDIWLTIRNPGTFLPSLYSEALRWGNFKQFTGLYEGYYKQSWMPVIDTIARGFNEARINILLYENYDENCPRLLKALTGQAIQLHEKHRMPIYPSLNAFSIQSAAKIDLLLKGHTSPKIVRLFNAVSTPFMKDKFSPFSDEQLKELGDIYRRDKKEIISDKKLHHFGKGWEL